MANNIEGPVPEETDLEPHKHKFSRVPDHHQYEEPETILDPTSRFEQDDRGDGMGVHDEKTYGHTEK